MGLRLRCESNQAVCTFVFLGLGGLGTRCECEIDTWMCGIITRREIKVGREEPIRTREGVRELSDTDIV